MSEELNKDLVIIIEHYGLTEEVLDEGSRVTFEQNKEAKIKFYEELKKQFGES